MAVLGRLFSAIALQRRGWWLLLGINSLGSLYGFWWYKNQLMETPWWQWLLVPDSPGATFLFSIWLILLLGGADWRRPGMQLLGAVAFVANMKYGLWTATVLPYAGITLGWEFDFVHLSLSHFGMWLQAIIFARHYRPALFPATAALLFMWFQDLIDYRVWMSHPTLPAEATFLFARNMAVILSTTWGGFLVWQARFDKRSTRL